MSGHSPAVSLLLAICWIVVAAAFAFTVIPVARDLIHRTQSVLTAVTK